MSPYPVYSLGLPKKKKKKKKEEKEEKIIPEYRSGTRMRTMERYRILTGKEPTPTMRRAREAEDVFKPILDEKGVISGHRGFWRGTGKAIYKLIRTLKGKDRTIALKNLKNELMGKHKKMHIDWEIFDAIVEVLLEYEKA